MKIIYVILALGTLSGCSLLPEKPPAVPVSELAPLAWEPVVTDRSDGYSIDLSHDPYLDTLITSAFNTNYSVLKSRFDSLEASAVYSQISGGAFPKLNYSDGYTKGDSGFGISKTRTQTASVSQGISLFGELKAAKAMQESLVASSTIAEDQAKLSVINSIAIAYISGKGFEAQIATLETLFNKYQVYKKMMSRKIELGAESSDALIPINTSINNIFSQLSSAREQRDLSIKSLVYLTGISELELTDGLRSTLFTYQGGSISYPQVAVPSSVIASRPDVLKAKEGITYSIRNYQTVWAERFPQLSLAGSISIRTTVGALSPAMAAGSRITSWSLGPTLTLSLLDPTWFGKKEQANVQYEKAVLAYKDSVNVAVQDIESAIVSLNYKFESYSYAYDEFINSNQLLSTYVKKDKAGSISKMDLMSQEITALSAELNLITAYSAVVQAGAKLSTATNSWRKI